MFRFAVLIGLVCASFGMMAAESDLADIAAALGLPRNSTKASILKAIAGKPRTQDPIQRVDKHVEDYFHGDNSKWLQTWLVMSTEAWVQKNIRDA